MAVRLSSRWLACAAVLLLAAGSLPAQNAERDPPPPPAKDQPAQDPPAAKSPLKITIVSPAAIHQSRAFALSVKVENPSAESLKNVRLRAILDGRVTHENGNILAILLGDFAPQESRSVSLTLQTAQTGNAKVRIQGVAPHHLEAEGVITVQKLPQPNPPVSVPDPPAQPAASAPLIPLPPLPPPPSQPQPAPAPAAPTTVVQAVPNDGPVQRVVFDPPKSFERVGVDFGFPNMRMQFHISPRAMLKDLLPTPPARPVGPRPFLPGRFDLVPEIAFMGMMDKKDPKKNSLDMAHQIAKINHLNAASKRRDHFMDALIANRPDLDGLPFVMGEDCRTKEDLHKQFTLAVNLMRRAMSGGKGGGGRSSSAESLVNSVTFWDQFNRLIAELESQDAILQEKHEREHMIQGRVRAMMQVCGPETASMKRGLARFLGGTAHRDSTRALAQLAVYAPEAEVRNDALDALRTRRERDYSDILVDGLRYPWPQVAKNAADAIAKLERTDLAEKLIEAMEAADPRAPFDQAEDGKNVKMVRELVKINHHRNCLLCHPPGNTPDVQQALTGGVPIPGEPLPSFQDGYQTQTPDILVRIDATYLKQDFSLMLPVPDAHPWPEKQRFDFLVRTRPVTEDEVAQFQKVHAQREPGVLNPYHRAAVAALRDLTGRDAAPTPQAWRDLLRLPKK